MLHLLQAYTGCPQSELLHFLRLPHESLLLYPSSDSVIVLNARDLVFRRALAFWEAFPGTRHLNAPVKCLAIDAGMKLVVAALGPRIAAWTLSGIHNDSWRLHSTLLLSDNQQVSTLDCEAGLLAVGTTSSLSIYTLILDNDLPTWSQKWACPVSPLLRVRFSPSLMYIATTSSKDNVIRLHATTSGRQIQQIPHPRPVTNFDWRRSQASRDDLILYTVTTDATLRIFLPVLDAPRHLQLHAALDPYSGSTAAHTSKPSTIFWLDRNSISTTLEATLSKLSKGVEDGRSRRIREIKEEGWDLFLRVLGDGSVVVQAVANIDRRPPTLLKQFTLVQYPPGTLPQPPKRLHVLPYNDSSSCALTLLTSPPLTSYTLSPLPFFDAGANGILPHILGSDQRGGSDEPKRDISRFVRTPDGTGVAALNIDGSVESWEVAQERGSNIVLRQEMRVDEHGPSVDLVVVLEAGRSFVTYSKSENTLTLHGRISATLSVPPLVSLFSLPSATIPSKQAAHPSLVGVTNDHTIILLSIGVPDSSSPNDTSDILNIYSHTILPLSAPPKLILPVDPMAWTSHYNTERFANAQEHDVLLSASEDGELAFWVPEDIITGNGPGSLPTNVVDATVGGWRCTGRVRTGRRGLTRAVCSSAKKSALVLPGCDGEELTIWDSKESEFASGLEYRQVLSASDPINDLDWSATPDNQSILAIGFAHHIDILCQQRMTYFDETPGWGVCWTIDTGGMIPHPISDSIWLAQGSLLVGAGHLILLYGQQKAVASDSNQDESLFEHVARHNGPLDDYHPQMLLQCLLWEKVEVVKDIIVNLARNLESGRSHHEWQGVPIANFLRRDEVARASHAPHKPQYSLLFTVPETTDESDDDPFSPSLVQKLLENMEDRPLPHLTPNEHASLMVLIQTTLDIQEQRRALDSNGLRYLISMRVFYILNRRLSAPTTPASNTTIAVQLPRRERLRYRDVIWAFHSESQELLLSMSVTACGGKMGWTEARALGVFLWLRSGESMRAHMEVVARNQYMAGDNRDPTQCSLLYFALGKVKLVHGLWRQAAWHREQSVMLKFLSNDFTQPRWRTAALKNAFALLSKRRFEYAAAFFLLGGSLKDAVSVCIKNLGDFQLAVALARVIEQGDDGPILKEILEGTVLPYSFKEGNRWLASWAFWLLNRRDLAVRILVTPLQDMATVISTTLDVQIQEIGEPHYDDPSLALLFTQLKSKTLQTAKGTSEIPGRTEFNFVLQIARVFCRMGCHALALDLVRTWSFERPSIVTHDHPSDRPPPSPVSTRFALEPALLRRSSILIDMDVTTSPPTPPFSENGVSVPALSNGKEHKEGDMDARKAGLGNLLKSAKQDVNVPEFNMDAFF